MRALRVNQNSKVAARQLNNELNLAIKLRKAEGSCRVGSLQVTPLTLHFIIRYIVIIKNIDYSHFKVFLSVRSLLLSCHCIAS